MIHLVNISKRFGPVTALSQVSLEIRPGERLALIGENGAGKSSLMNVLYGLYQPDQGEVRFDGHAVVVRTPAEALTRGVGMVHQHFTLVPTLTVVENVVLGHEPTTWGRIDHARARADVAATCARLGFSLELDAKVSALSVGSQQKVEIIKALHRGVTTLILDEPTAVLTPQEADELFAVTRKLSESGMAIVLISHKLKDVLSFATRIAVMRRGEKVLETTPAQTSESALASVMTTNSLSPWGEGQGEGKSGAPILTISSLQSRPLHAISLTLHAGEILGIAGVDGNGQRELAEVLTGLRKWNAGTISINDTPLTSLTPHLARSLGIAHIPEDRLHRAIVGDCTVEENVSLGRETQAPFSRGPRIDFAGRRARTVSLMEAHDVRPREPTVRVAALSGGNQQKLVVARELDGNPRVLIVVQPTRGLDIAAVHAVRGALRAQRDAGCAILLISLDLDEVVELSDRLLVMYAGAITAELKPAEYDQRLIGKRMLGVMDA